MHLFLINSITECSNFVGIEKDSNDNVLYFALKQIFACFSFEESLQIDSGEDNRHNISFVLNL